MDVQLRQNFGTGGSPSAQVNTPSQSVAFQVGLSGRSSLTFDVPSIVGKTLGTNDNDYLEVIFVLQNANANTIYLADASLVEGDATAEDDPFSPRHIQQELALCQRYFQKTFLNADAPGGNKGFVGVIAGLASAAGNVIASWDFAVPLRTASYTLTTYNPTAGLAGYWSNFAGTFSAAVGLVYKSERGITMTAVPNTSLNDNFCGIHATVDAEL